MKSTDTCGVGSAVSAVGTAPPAVRPRDSERGGAGARAVREEPAVLFLDKSGTRKSTRAACSRRGRGVSEALPLIVADQRGRREIVGRAGADHLPAQLRFRPDDRFRAGFRRAGS